MTTLEYSTFTQAIQELFNEAYTGPPDASSTWFVDNQLDAGVLGLIKNLTAADASLSVDGSGKPGSTIASNVEHLRWSLANANGALRGDPYQANWSESWSVTTVDEKEWASLRGELSKEFTLLHDLLPQLQSLPRDELLGVMALAPHAAMHLGIMRQMVERVHLR